MHVAVLNCRRSLCKNGLYFQMSVNSDIKPDPIAYLSNEPGAKSVKWG